MRLRSFLLALASTAIGIVLIVFLILVAKIDPRATVRQLGNTNRIAFAKLTLLMAYTPICPPGNGDSWMPSSAAPAMQLCPDRRLSPSRAPESLLDRSSRCQ